MTTPASPTRFLFALLLIGLLSARAALGQDPARTVSETVPLAADGTVTIDNHEGRITVTTWDRDAVQYSAAIMPTDEDPRAEKTRIRVDQRSNQLRLATEHTDGNDESNVFGFSFDNGWQWGGTNIPSVHYTVTIPRTARLVIDDHESTIDVRGLRAALRIDTHEGPITVVDQQGAVTIDSHESRMALRTIDGPLTIDTHEGDVTVTDLRGAFELDTHDGTADVAFAALAGDVEVDTHDGRITLTLPAGAGFDLSTDFSDDARLTSDFDLAALRITDDDEDDEVNYRGAVNGGGPHIELSAHDGRFALRQR